MRKIALLLAAAAAFAMAAIADEYVEAWLKAPFGEDPTLTLRIGFLEEFWWDNLWFDSYLQLDLDLGGPDDTWSCFIGFRVGDRKHFLAGGFLYEPGDRWGFLIHFRVPFNLPVEFNPEPVVLD